MNSTLNSFYKSKRDKKLQTMSEASRPISAFFIYSEFKNEMERKINDEKREFDYLQKAVNYKK
jgi:hypothetical protein